MVILEKNLGTRIRRSPSEAAEPTIDFPITRVVSGFLAAVGWRVCLAAKDQV